MNTYRIIKIIDEYKVVINAGTDDLIRYSTKFEVFVEGEEIFDPVTNESLGTLDTIKARLKVHTLFKKMTICISDEYTEKQSSIAQAALSISAFATPISVRKPLNIDATEISGGLVSGEKIKVGDLVRKSTH